jgi:hypothetical protein
MNSDNLNVTKDFHITEVSLIDSLNLWNSFFFSRLSSNEDLFVDITHYRRTLPILTIGVSGHEHILVLYFLYLIAVFCCTDCICKICLEARGCKASDIYFILFKIVSYHIIFG